MNIDASVGLLIILAVCAANMPFINQRLFALIALPWKKKPFKWRLLELSILYFLLGILAYYLEEHLGNVADKKWEIYVISLCLFLVFAFPGFVYQYLYKNVARRK